MAKSKYREEFINDYQMKGVDFIMKKYGTVPFAEKVKNKRLKFMEGYKLSNTQYADYSKRRAA